MAEDRPPVVLTIDDEQVIRESFRNFLEDLDYEILEAENGRVGLEVFDREKPDLVLVDLRMPEVDGLDVLSSVYKSSPDVPIIVVSGTGVIGDAVEALRLGAWDYLLKPVEDLTVLGHAVSRALERARLIRENRRHQEHLEEEVARQTGELKSANEDLRREIATRQETEQRLADSETMLDSILRSIPDVIYRLDPDGRISFVNEAVRRYGYRPQDLIGKNVLDIVHQEDRGRVSERICERRTGERRTRNLEVRLLGQNCEALCFEVRAKDVSMQPVFLVEAEGLYAGPSPSGEHFLGTQGVARDITQRKQAEEALHRQSEALEQSLDGIAIADLAGNIQFVNTAWAVMHGYETEELTGGHMGLFHTKEQIDEQVLDFLDAVRTKGGCNREVDHMRKHGTIFPTRMSASSLKNNAGEPIGTVFIAHDITEERELEEQLRQAQKVESIGRLAGGVAHDFNNLLSPILGYTEMLLLDTSEDDPRREDLAEIHSAAERAKDLIRQLLAFSRKQLLEMKTTNLAEVIKGFERILRRTLREDIELRLSLSASSGAVRADVSQLEQILMNLGVNAQDAMPNGGTLSVETAEILVDEEYARTHPGLAPGRYEVLRVSDTGVGMTEEVVQQIFEPFFTTKGEGQGTGLGLATVYGIAKQHGGGIWAYSEAGLGTTFQVYFPRVEQEDGEASKKDLEEPAAVVGGSETVLVVEDNDSVRSLVCSVLASHGYSVLNAESPADCLRLLDTHEGHIDLLFTDVIMPGMNGRELYERLAPNLPGVKVLYMSGYTDDVIAHHGLLEEGVNFIQKPLSVQSVAGKVREVLDS